MAWREMRASKGRFLFVVLAVAVGVASLTGVRGFSRAFRRMLLADARTLMAGDMSLRVFALPSPGQLAVLQRLEHRGVRRTWVTETITMAVSAEVPDPLLTQLKAVDPSVYPFYGKLRTEPAAALDADSAWVSEDLLVRLKTRVGEDLRIGGQPFRIAAVLVSEPDRMTGSLNIGPRVMITRAGLDRTGLMGVGSRAAQRYLFRLPPRGPGVEQVRRVLKRTFPEATIADFRETHPVITRGLNRATTFLSLVSLIALIVGALGVGTAMHAHIRQKMDTIAVLKCLGARSAQVMRIFLVQTVLLGLAGGALGVVLGVLVARAFPSLIATYFPQTPQLGWDWLPAAQGLGIGLLATLLFSAPPLMAVRRVRPLVILRRDIQGTGMRISWPAAAASAAIVLGIGAIAATLTEGTARQGLRTGVVFAGGLTVGLLAMAGVAKLLIRLLRAVSLARMPMAVRHGLANLYRPGSQATAVLVALGIGVMFTLAVWLLQHSLLVQMANSAPREMPNVFLLDIPGPQRQALVDLARRQAGVESGLEVMPSVAAKIARIDGVPVERLPLHDFGRRFLRTRAVTWMAAKPPETEIIGGQWWKAEPHPEPQVCVNEDAAQILKIRAGERLSWNFWGKTVETRVACVERTESIRMAARFEFLFSPGVLEGFPAIYYGSMRVKPRDVVGLQRVLYDRFPAVTVINTADVLETVQKVIDQIALVYEFISFFTIAAGAVILASAVAGTRFRRIRETAILKALGATRRRVSAIFSVEFLVLGAVAGAAGALLANGFSALVLKRLLEVDFRFDPLPNLAAVALSALLANAAGWTASFRILGQKPLEVLRDE